MKKYLVCLDSSSRAEGVLRAAVDLARQTGGRLTLFHAVGLPADIGHADLVDVFPAKIPETMLTVAQRSLERQRAAIEGDLVEAAEAKLGTPWDAICREAKAIGADLIILGSHGYGGLDRILGTTAAKVVNHAECSVLVVR